MVDRSVNIQGQTFGDLTVLGRGYSAGRKHRSAIWLCRCECGNLTQVRGEFLRAGKTKSCGCLSAKRAVEIHSTHGMSNTPEYAAWVNMRRRCSDTSSRHYKNYGGRGIRVFPKWEVSFEEFFKEVGLRPTPAHELDRIDNDGNYEPGNVRWLLRAENQLNRRPKAWWVIDGERYQSLAAAASVFGVCERTIANWCKGSRPNCHKRSLS